MKSTFPYPCAIFYVHLYVSIGLHREGFLAGALADTCANSLSVLKTIRQTSASPITYAAAARQVLAKDGNRFFSEAADGQSQVGGRLGGGINIARLRDHSWAGRDLLLEGIATRTHPSDGVKSAPHTKRIVFSSSVRRRALLVIITRRSSSSRRSTFPFLRRK